MISHISIYNTPSDIYRLVIFYIKEDFWKASQSLLELVDSVEHKTQVEPRTYEVLLDAQSFFVPFNCQCNEIFILLTELGEIYFSLTLVSETLRMKKLSIIWG